MKAQVRVCFRRCSNNESRLPFAENTVDEFTNVRLSAVHYGGPPAGSRFFARECGSESRAAGEALPREAAPLPRGLTIVPREAAPLPPEGAIHSRTAEIGRSRGMDLRSRGTEARFRGRGHPVRTRLAGHAPRPGKPRPRPGRLRPLSGRSWYRPRTEHRKRRTLRGRVRLDHRWWRHGESNSGPRQLPDRHLQAQSLVWIRTRCAQRHARGVLTGSVLARAIPITCVGAFPLDDVAPGQGTSRG